MTVTISKKQSIRDFWKMRSAKYNQLQWATSNQYSKRFLDAGAFQKTDKVVDMGCGTGIVTNLVAPHVKEVIGVDISEDMLASAIKNKMPNESFLLADMCDLTFEDNTFDKATVRLVLHHLMDKVQDGVDESFRILKPGGAIIVSEGIPPGEEIADWYTEMFKYKEERLTFSEEMLTGYLSKAGFSDIFVDRYVMPQASIKNWIEKSGIPKVNQDIIMKMHREMPEVGRKLYNATFTDDDVLLDMVFLILIGHKA